MTCGRVSPLSTQSTFEDLAVDFKEQKIAFKACGKKGAEESIVSHKEKITNDFIVNPYAQTVP